MDWFKQKLAGLNRRIAALQLSELNQPRLDSAIAWMQRSRVGVMLLNLAAMMILTAVRLLKKVKQRLMGREPQIVMTQQQLSLLHQVQDKPRVCIIAEATIPQCLHYRVKQKVEQLTALECHIEWCDWADMEVARKRLYFNDIIIAYRIPGFPKVLDLLEQAKKLNKLVIYDVDDLIFDRQELEKKFQTSTTELADRDIAGILTGADLFKAAMQAADYGIASTSALQAEVAKQVGKKQCFLLPNGLDSNIENLRDGKVVKEEGEVTIFYGSGTKTHDADFATIAEPLTRVLAENKQVRLVVVGHLGLPDSMQPLKEQIQQLPLLDFQMFLHCLKHADIAIAPLEPGKFADCKSEIKWLEAANFAVPCVVAKTACYEDVIEQGKTGLIAATEQEWFEALSKLVTDASYRQKIGQAALKQANKEYSATAMAKQMQQLLQQVQQQAVTDGLLLKPEKDKQHILFVNVLYPPQAIGGATTVVSQTVQQIRAEYSDQFQVTVLSSEMNDAAPYSVIEYEEQGVRVIVVGTPFHQHLETRVQDDNMFDLCRELYSQINPDLIHIHSVQRLTASAVEAAKNLEIPYLVTVHDAWWLTEHQFLLDKNDVLIDIKQSNPFIAYQSADNLNMAIQRQQYLSEQLQGAKRIIAVSDFQKSLYQQNGFDNIVTIRNGVTVSVEDKQNNFENKQSNTLVIGYLGGISAHKGYDFLREIVQQNQWSNLEFKLVDLFKPAVYSEISEWGTSKVIHIGKVETSEIADFYQSIDVLIAPSIWPESFGLVTREAALHGVWVVAADAGGMAEDVIEGETGFVFPMADQQKCAEILNRLNNQHTYFQQNQPNVELSQKRIFDVQASVAALVREYSAK